MLGAQPRRLTIVEPSRPETFAALLRDYPSTVAAGDRFKRVVGGQGLLVLRRCSRRRHHHRERGGWSRNGYIPSTRDPRAGDAPNHTGASIEAASAAASPHHGALGRPIITTAACPIPDRRRSPSRR